MATEITSIFKTGTCPRQLKGRNIEVLLCDKPNKSLTTFGRILGVADEQFAKVEIDCTHIQ
jgi:hypothetical protein